MENNDETRVEVVSCVEICEAYTQWNRRCGSRVESGSKYCARHAKKSYHTCEICYNDMYVPTKLACGHTYCKNCIYRWANRGSNCPMCRKDMFYVNHSKDVIIRRAQEMIARIDSLDPSCRDVNETCDAIDYLLQNEWLDAFDKEYKNILTFLVRSCEDRRCEKFRGKQHSSRRKLSLFKNIIRNIKEPPSTAT